ncbi:MAG TPA: DUF5335 family protein [Pyrinomonadaceae bacterium]|nr:DUF5335 family protein [Pyrinomonadaceae bacterium]
MQTRQIPKTEWPSFLDRFSRQYEGWLVNLEVFSPEIGAQVEETGLALEGLTDEWDEVKGNTIMIMAGNTPDDHITHSITNPTEVTLEQTDEGADVALSIKSTDGTTALLSFRAAVLPETVDARVV